MSKDPLKKDGRFRRFVKRQVVDGSISAIVGGAATLASYPFVDSLIQDTVAGKSADIKTAQHFDEPVPAAPTKAEILHDVREALPYDLAGRVIHEGATLVFPTKLHEAWIHHATVRDLLTAHYCQGQKPETVNHEALKQQLTRDFGMDAGTKLYEQWAKTNPAPERSVLGDIGKWLIDRQEEGIGRTQEALSKLGLETFAEQVTLVPIQPGKLSDKDIQLYVKALSPHTGASSRIVYLIGPESEARIKQDAARIVGPIRKDLRERGVPDEIISRVDVTDVSYEAGNGVSVHGITGLPIKWVFSGEVRKLFGDDLRAIKLDDNVRSTIHALYQEGDRPHDIPKHILFFPTSYALDDAVLKEITKQKQENGFEVMLVPDHVFESLPRVQDGLYEKAAAKNLSPEEFAKTVLDLKAARVKSIQYAGNTGTKLSLEKLTKAEGANLVYGVPAELSIPTQTIDYSLHLVTPDGVRVNKSEIEAALKAPQQHAELVTKIKAQLNGGTVDQKDLDALARCAVKEYLAVPDIQQAQMLMQKYNGNPSQSGVQSYLQSKGIDARLVTPDYLAALPLASPQAPKEMKAVVQEKADFDFPVPKFTPLDMLGLSGTIGVYVGLGTFAAIKAVRASATLTGYALKAAGYIVNPLSILKNFRGGQK